VALDQEFGSLIGDVSDGSPDAVAERLSLCIAGWRHSILVMSTEWAGMPETLATETSE